MHFEVEKVSHVDFVDWYLDMKLYDMKSLATGSFNLCDPSNLHILPNKVIFHSVGYNSVTVGCSVL